MCREWGTSQQCCSSVLAWTTHRNSDGKGKGGKHGHKPLFEMEVAANPAEPVSTHSGEFGSLENNAMDINRYGSRNNPLRGAR